jgi:hypothetical protein
VTTRTRRTFHVICHNCSCHTLLPSRHHGPSPPDSESPASLVPFVQTPRADSPLPFQLRAPVPVRYDLICMISPGSSWYLPFPFDLYHRYKTVPLFLIPLAFISECLVRSMFFYFWFEWVSVCIRSLPPGRSPVILQLSSPAVLEKP